MDAPTQLYRQFSIASPLGEDVLLFRRMQAKERLGGLFEYRIDALSENDQVDFRAILGQNMTVRMNLATEESNGGSDDQRYFNGYVSEFSQLTNDGRFAAYRIVLRPWLWFLTRTSDCRIFQKQTVPQIVKKVLRDNGFSDFQERFSNNYREREYCVQYRESDYNFVSRLMEEEGIYYYFRHEDGKHVLILADSYSAHDTVSGYEEIPYYPPGSSDKRRCEHIFDWSFSQQVQPGRFALTDYDFTAPRKSLYSILDIPREYAQSHYEVFDYPGEYTEAADGEAYARKRIEELQAQHEALSGRGNARGLSTGALFSLSRCPREDQNRQFLVTEATYNLEADGYESGADSGDGPIYECSFKVIDAKQPFRTPRTTVRPTVKGPQSAIVVGPAGEEIWTDKFGRVKVQFHWDRYGKFDERSSCWVRVSHPWAGKGWGAVSIPRIGQEVIVDFLEGDPDQPVITGRVYNADQMPPYPLPDKKVISGIKSNSTKGGGGYNEFSMDDTKGKEKINIHAQYDMETTVLHDDTQTVHNDRVIKVNNTHHETIKQDTTIIVSKGNYKLDVMTGTSTHHVKDQVVERYDSSQTTIVKGSIFTQSVEGAVLITAASSITLMTGKSSLVMGSDGTIKLSGAKIEISGSEEVKIGVGNQNVTCNKQEVATGGAAIKSSAVGVHEIGGAIVKIN